MNKRKAGRFLRVAQYVPRTVIIAIKTGQQTKMKTQFSLKFFY